MKTLALKQTEDKLIIHEKGNEEEIYYISRLFEYDYNGYNLVGLSISVFDFISRMQQRGYKIDFNIKGYKEEWGGVI